MFNNALHFALFALVCGLVSLSGGMKFQKPGLCNSLTVCIAANLAAYGARPDTVLTTTTVVETLTFYESQARSLIVIASPTVSKSTPGHSTAPSSVPTYHISKPGVDCGVMFPGLGFRPCIIKSTVLSHSIDNDQISDSMPSVSEVIFVYQA